MRLKPACCAAALLLGGLAAGAAFAHSDTPSTGMVAALVATSGLQWLASPLTLAALLGLALVLSAGHLRWFIPALLAATAAALATLWPDHRVIMSAPFGVMLLGLAAAWGRPLPAIVCASLALLAGASGAAAVDLGTPGWVDAAGVALAFGLLPLLGAQGLKRLCAMQSFPIVVPMACRVAGAWIAAIGVLMGALVLKTYYG